MELEWDEAKREATLRLRWLDFARAGEVFGGLNLTVEDDRRDYGEVRYQTVGLLAARVVMVVWTPRGSRRRIISMRTCDERERHAFHAASSGGG